MEVGKNFANIGSYNANMRKGMEDKLFFLNKINLSKSIKTIYVDFGCADGALINTMCSIAPKKEKYSYQDIYIGYDISDTMINFAKTNFDQVQTSDKVVFTSKWKEVEEILKNEKYATKVLILSSVIHEVYSYGTKKDIDEFWDRVLNSGFDYICVRDMMISENYNQPENTYGPSSLRNSIKNSDIINIDTLNEFENKWGSVEESKKNYLHFLLKYRWQVNWDRELNENYFPITIEDFLSKFSKKYNINYFERFYVPFLRDCINKDFGIDLEKVGYTHIKGIFELK